MLSISACLIVKDEENTLARCLESIKNYVNEIIVVDTGSRDQTKDIALKYGAKVIEYKWENDFSKARNLSLSYANQPWILWLDADEVFIEKHPDALSNLLVENNIDGFEISVNNFLGENEKQITDTVWNKSTRIFKNNNKHYFNGKIHETLDYSFYNSKATVKFSNLVEINHYGYLKEIKQSKNKNKRNIDLITVELTKNPNSSFHNFNMGMEYFTNEQYAKALGFYEKSIKYCLGNEVYYPRLLRNTIMAYLETGKLEKAYRICKTALGKFSDYTDLWYLYALIYNKKEEYKRAIDAITKAISLGDCKTFEGNQGLGSYKALFLLSEIYFKMGDTQSGIEALISGTEKYPNIIKFFTELGQMFINQGNLEVAREVFYLGSKHHNELLEIYNKISVLLEKYQQ